MVTKLILKTEHTVKMSAKKWIQKAKIKEGALSRQLSIPISENIPVTLLKKIKSAEVGTIVKNPTKMGKQEIPVTLLLKRRVVLALTLKGFK